MITGYSQTYTRNPRLAASMMVRYGWRLCLLLLYLFDAAKPRNSFIWPHNFYIPLTTRQNVYVPPSYSDPSQTRLSLKRRKQTIVRIIGPAAKPVYRKGAPDLQSCPVAIGDIVPIAWPSASPGRLRAPADYSVWLRGCFKGLNLGTKVDSGTKRVAKRFWKRRAL